MRTIHLIYSSFLLVSLISVSAAADTTSETLGCKQQAVPCSGHGKCTRNSVCLCDLYYTGTFCENVLATDDRKEVDTKGISTGGLIGIILGWIGFVIFSVAGFFYAFYRLSKGNSRWSRKPKAMLGSLPNQPPTQLNIGERIESPPDGMHIMATELSHLNQNVSRMMENIPTLRKRNDLDNSLQEGVSQLDINNESYTLPETRDITSTIPENRYKRMDTVQSETAEEAGKLRAPLSDNLARRIEGYRMLALNLPGQYSRDSQTFVMDADPIKDVPGQIARNVLYDEDYSRNADIRDTDHISLNVGTPMRGSRNTFRNFEPDSTQIGEEGNIGRSYSARKY